ncbi:hypothetical protein HDU76_007908 [Blyttiomyces sp. JEL0837]|nr:hypothetical protein HDU76_007908 [Blyttiomyces sp. JEL0837]
MNTTNAHHQHKEVVVNDPVKMASKRDDGPGEHRSAPANVTKRVITMKEYMSRNEQNTSEKKLEEVSKIRSKLPIRVHQQGSSSDGSAAAQKSPQSGIASVLNSSKTPTILSPQLNKPSSPRAQEAQEKSTSRAGSPRQGFDQASQQTTAANVAKPGTPTNKSKSGVSVKPDNVGSQWPTPFTSTKPTKQSGRSSTSSSKNDTSSSSSNSASGCKTLPASSSRPAVNHSSGPKPAPGTPQRFPEKHSSVIAPKHTSTNTHGSKITSGKDVQKIARAQQPHTTSTPLSTSKSDSSSTRPVVSKTHTRSRPTIPTTVTRRDSKLDPSEPPGQGKTGPSQSKEHNRDVPQSPPPPPPPPRLASQQPTLQPTTPSFSLLRYLSEKNEIEASVHKEFTQHQSYYADAVKAMEGKNTLPNHQNLPPTNNRLMSTKGCWKCWIFLTPDVMTKAMKDYQDQVIKWREKCEAWEAGLSREFGRFLREHNAEKVKAASAHTEIVVRRTRMRVLWRWVVCV